jgi:DNA-binding PadR family transcriptional regulator
MARPAPDPKLLTREILLGFWKAHILHHAGEHPVFGQWVLTELRRHGYDISPGTLYPLLQRMERNGWLQSETEPGAGRRGRRYYRLTASGADVLAVVRQAAGELQREVVDGARGGGRRESGVRAATDRGHLSRGEGRARAGPQRLPRTSMRGRLKR